MRSCARSLRTSNSWILSRATSVTRAAPPSTKATSRSQLHIPQSPQRWSYGQPLDHSHYGKQWFLAFTHVRPPFPFLARTMRMRYLGVRRSRAIGSRLIIFRLRSTRISVSRFTFGFPERPVYPHLRRCFAHSPDVVSKPLRLVLISRSTTVVVGCSSHGCNATHRCQPIISRSHTHWAHASRTHCNHEGYSI